MSRKFGTISYQEYKRRVFNKAFLECCSKIHSECTGFDCADPKQKNLVEMGKKMCDKFYTDMLDLNSCTIDKTKANLNGACTFIKDCVNVCESVACSKCEDAAEEELEIPEEQEIELGPEDQAVIDKLFDEKNPELQVDQVRDATVKALIAEDKRAQEIKDSLDIAQSQATAEGKPEVMEETVKRINGRSPTSLMNAILNAVSGMAVKDINENSKTPVSIGSVMKENSEEIKNRSILLYTLYESASVFGIHKFTQDEIKAEAKKSYYGVGM